jgi:transcriptional regulator with XRE-family HTH domain
MTLLKQQRINRNLSQAQVAAEMGIGQPQYHRIEVMNLAASKDLAERLSAFFGVTVTDLFQPARYCAIPATEEFTYPEPSK